jgi:hypothetical protein
MYFLNNYLQFRESRLWRHFWENFWEMSSELIICETIRLDRTLFMSREVVSSPTTILDAYLKTAMFRTVW